MRLAGRRSGTLPAAGIARSTVEVRFRQVAVDQHGEAAAVSGAGRIPTFV